MKILIVPHHGDPKKVGVVYSYGYGNPMGYQTSDFRLLWAITPNPQPPKPPMIGLCPPPPPISHLCFETMTVGMN